MSWPPPTVPGPPPRVPRPPTPPRARRWALAGLTAGMLVGTTVGLVAVSPRGAGATTAPPVVTDDAAAGPGERLREILEPLVDDGTLTADQRDAVVAALEAAGPIVDRRGPFHRHRPGDLDGLAALFGIDVDELRDELDGGRALADIAAEHGVDVEAVIDVLVAAAEARLDDAVADGWLTEEQAAERAARLREWITASVHGDLPDPLRPEQPHLDGPRERSHRLPERPDLPEWPDSREWPDLPERPDLREWPDLPGRPDCADAADPDAAA